MSMSELAQLGGGKIAYIKVMTADEAKQMFPAVEGIPAGIDLFALHAADGTPIALTDSRQAALGKALGDELVIASLHCGAAGASPQQPRRICERPAPAGALRFCAARIAV
jgi:hypothetical protein